MRRIVAAASLTLAGAIGTGAAGAEVTVEAAFVDPLAGSPAGAARPAWRGIEVLRRGDAGQSGGLATGQTSLRRRLESDPGGYFLGHAPQVADVNGDGRPDVAAIQYLPEDGWRLVIYDLRATGIAVLGQAQLNADVTQAALIGIADLQRNGTAEIAVALTRGAAGAALYLYSFAGERPLSLGPFAGLGAGSAQAPGGPAFLLAFLPATGDAPVIAAIRLAGDGRDLRIRLSSFPATAAGFAAAAACD